MKSLDIHGTFFSTKRVYRWLLYRDLHDLAMTNGPPCAFCQLNPSVADEKKDDNTSIRNISTARALLCPDLFLINAFAICGTDRSIVRQVADPVGPENDTYIRAVAEEVRDRQGYFICGWGPDGGHHDRDLQVLAILREVGVRPHCLRVTKGGYPEHSLYLPGGLEPFPYTTGRAA